MSKKVIKTFKGRIKSVDPKTHTVEAVISDQTVDRYQEVILANAWKKRLSTYKKHPVLLSSHSYRSLRSQIGELKNVKINNDDRSLEAKIKYYVGEGNPEADWGFKLAEKGIAAFSVGFIAHSAVDKWGMDEDDYKDFLKENGLRAGDNIRRVFTDVELLENSQVVVPANPSALQKSMKDVDSVVVDVAKSIDEAIEKGDIEVDKTDVDMEERGVVTFKEYPLMDKTAKWSGAQSKKRIEEWAKGEDDSISFTKYRKGFLWYNSEESELKGSYKAPHHDIVDGEMKTHWRGVVAAMVVLLGGRGGLDIPESDKKSAYNHLAKHYRSFEEEPPEFKDYDCADDVIDGCKDIETASLMLEHIYELRQADIVTAIVEHDSVTKALSTNLKNMVNDLKSEIIDLINLELDMVRSELNVFINSDTIDHQKFSEDLKETVKEASDDTKEDDDGTDTYIKAILETTKSLKGDSV